MSNSTAHRRTPCHCDVPLHESDIERVHLPNSGTPRVHTAEAHNLVRRLGVFAWPERDRESKPDVRVAESTMQTVPAPDDVCPYVLIPLDELRSLALVREDSRKVQASLATPGAAEQCRRETERIYPFSTFHSPHEFAQLTTGTGSPGIDDRVQALLQSRKAVRVHWYVVWTVHNPAYFGREREIRSIEAICP